MATRTRRTPVTGGFARPVIASLNMIEFIREGDFGVLYGPNGEIISDDVKDILVFLDPQITGEDGRLEDNVFYGITTHRILLRLLNIYFRHNNLMIKDHIVIADDLIKKHFGNLLDKEYDLNTVNFAFLDFNETVSRNTEKPIWFGFLLDKNAENPNRGRFAFMDFNKILSLNTRTTGHDISWLRSDMVFGEGYGELDHEGYGEWDRQIDKYIEETEKYDESSQIVPYLQIASRIVTGNESNDISMVYEVNPPLYMRAMNDNIHQYLSATNRYLKKLEIERGKGRFIKTARK